MAEATAKIRRREHELRVAPGSKGRCQCGQQLPGGITMLKVDAAQFYKSASTERGLRRAEQLLKRVAKRTRMHYVAVRKGQKAE
eukprot:2827347-Lingulodinium_polyedra.AAC.1